MKSIAIVAVRILGAYLVATNASVFATMFAAQLSYPDSIRITTPWMTPAALAMAGVAIILWSKGLGALLVSGVEAPAGPNVDATQLLQVGTALLALFCFASAASSIVAAVWDFLRQVSDESAIAEVRRQRVVSSTVSAATSLVVGALLLWLARGVFVRHRVPATSS